MRSPAKHHSFFGFVLACFVALLCTSCIATTPAPAQGLPAPEEVRRIVQDVADWQLDNPYTADRRDWIAGAWYAGLYAAAETTGKPEYFDAMRKIGNKTDWQVGDDRFHADDQAVAQMYLLMYMRNRNPKMLEPSLDVFEDMLTLDHSDSLEFNKEKKSTDWVWCDALFMAPPAMALLTRATGDTRFIDEMDRLWWRTTNFLYDKQENLYYRDSRFFDDQAPNGEKVFWSRGNGWVAGGLVRVLQSLPYGHPERSRYLTLYREMAEKVVQVQTDDGTWHPNLLAPSHPDTPETSGTGFFTYFLAWGINQDILDPEEYLPHVLDAWRALTDAVHDSGKLGWVQQVGDAPSPTNAESTAPYGVGAFLLAGSEVHKLALFENSGSATVQVTNPIKQPRFYGSIELDWADVRQRLPDASTGNLVVVDGQSGKILRRQFLDENGDGEIERLLLQGDFLPTESKTFDIRTLSQDLPPQPPSRVFGRYFPERSDDVAWENDRTAFRVYGPARADEGSRSGIDAWIKDSRKLVVNRTYKRENYHVFDGEAVDAYDVGSGAGAGGAAIYADGQLFNSSVYATQNRVANGPLRVSFRLSYEPWDTPVDSISMSQTISLDRGHHFNRIQVRFDGEDDQKELPVAAGLARHDDVGTIAHDAQARWLSYWKPIADARGTNLGHFGIGLLFPNAESPQYVRTQDHLALTVSHATDQPFVYYAGTGWSESMDVSSRSDWERRLQDQLARLNNPLQVDWNN
jgi:unsaturated rhamnogalacturonyl hydrolase